MSRSSSRRGAVALLGLALLSACASAGGRSATPGESAGDEHLYPHPEAEGKGAGVTPAAALPPEAASWADSTLRSLTLREKVGQLIMPWVGGEYVSTDSPEFDQLREWVRKEGIGGVVISIGTPLAYADKLNEMQRLAKVPLLVASDMENGPGMRLGGIYALPSLLPQGGGTTFPPVMAIGAAGSDSLAYALGHVLGEEARAVGVQLVFGPVLDVNSNPDNPIINTRSFGEDPALVSRMAGAYIRGAHDAGLMTTGKHFPGHGDTDVDSHVALPTIRADSARLARVELVPFRAAVADGIDAIMTAHIAVVGVEGPDAPPATLSPHFMTGVLRRGMGFEGVLFTDAMTMGGVARRYGATEPLLLALEAGADVLLMPRDVHEAVETVLAAVRSGRISEARLDQSVRRLLEMKARAGLGRERLVDIGKVDDTVGTREHAAVARRVAERSLTLARDERGLVPLAKGTPRVLSVTYASTSDLVAGRVFDAELAAGGAEVESVRVDDRTTPAELRAIRSRAARADAVIASAYVQPRESAGTVAAGGGFPGLVRGLAADSAPVVAVSFGSPYLLSAFPNVPAYLLAWGGAPVSQEAAARALLGELPITGRLPISLPPYLEVGAGLDRAARLLGTPR